MNTELLIYQGKNGKILLREDGNNETIWANQKEISEIFWIDRTKGSRYINHVYSEAMISF